MQERLTEKIVRGLKPQNCDYEAMDTELRGFGLRVYPSGRRVWIYRYRYEGRLRRLTLGDWPVMNRDEALRACLQARHVRRFDDPMEVRERQKQAKRAERDAARQLQERDAYTLAVLAEEYLVHYAQPNKRSWREDRRMLERDVLPVLGDKPAHTVTRKDVIALLDSFIERGAPRMAGICRNVLRKAFSFASERGRIDVVNPCAGVRAPKHGRRSRWLSNAELKDLLLKLPACGLSADMQDVLRLQLLTGARKGEVVAACWREIDLDDGIWTQPPEKAKNGNEHMVMLSRQAADLIGRRPRRGAYLFPSESLGGHIRGDSVNTALTRALPVLKLEPFTPHDFRRTLTTWLARQGCTLEVRDRIFNHVPQGVDREHYNQHRYDAEARDWLQRWADHLDALTADNVIPLIKAG
jgi:integrase